MDFLVLSMSKSKASFVNHQGDDTLKIAYVIEWPKIFLKTLRASVDKFRNLTPNCKKGTLLRN